VVAQPSHVQQAINVAKQLLPSRNGHDKEPARTATAETVAVFQCLADVKARPVKWLWKPWIPRGAVTILDGDPGEGKSTIALDLTARVTRGWKMPPEGGEGEGQSPANVLLLSAEDNAETTIRPRLDLAGANPERVQLLVGILTGDGERPAVLPWDLQLVAEKIKREKIRLVVIDPFMAYLDGAIDSHRDQDVRRCFHVLKQVAEQTDTAVFIVRHLNKFMGGSALYRGGGSIGITGAVRSALLVGRDPNDAAVHVLAMNKTNLAKAPKSLAYRIEEVSDVAKIGWIGETELTAEDVVERPKKKDKQSTADGCAEAMKDLLISQDLESEALTTTLLEKGYSERTIKRARQALGVRSYRQGFGSEGKWMVGLQATDPDQRRVDDLWDRGAEAARDAERRASGDEWTPIVP
jgi:hypothetical protein